MDIQHLIDRLEQTLAESRRIPLTANLIVDEDRVFNIIDQLRVTLPEEVKKASRVEAEKDRILAQAKEEGDRIRELAKQEAAELVRRDTIMAAAQQRADTILERARREADILRHDSDTYVMEVLSKLEEDLLRSLSVVRNGMRKIQVEHEAMVANEPQSQPVNK
jgi:cell division septum initiation protein DivIVA